MNYGEIVQLGRHRLMCGDATKYEDIEQLLGGERVNLVLTDPPYGMKCQHKDGRIGSTYNNGFMSKYTPPRAYPQLIGDTSSDTARKHYSIVRVLTNRLIIWGGQYFADFLPVSGGWLFWDKQTAATNFSAGELAWRSFGKQVKKYSHKWNGCVRAGNRRLNLSNRVHPTQKPVELHMQILEDFTEPGDVILDCFGGSGTTLIAAHLTGRTCFMMEISSEYCDIIENRYNELADCPA